ncbi:MAG: AsmA family protein [Deltaproteobacteria bacterium]|nr:AsmA family protein [Deltaproteobacteria bacterium]
MQKQKKILVAVLVVLVVIAAASTFLYLFDFNRFKPLIGKTVRHYTGRDLIIGGDIRLTSVFPPGLTAERVTFQNASWGSRPYMVRVEKATACLDLKALLKGEIRFFRIRAEGAEVRFEFDDRGVSNFLLDIPETSGPVTIPALAFRDIQIQRSRLVYIDHRWHANLSMQVDRAVADIPGLDQPIRVRGDGRMQGLPCTVKGSVGPIAHWILPGHEQVFEAAARLGGTTARLEGKIRDPLQLRGIHLHLRAEGTSTRELTALAKMTALPDFGRYRFETQLNDDRGHLAVESFMADVGSDDRVAVTVNGSVRNLSEMTGIDLGLRLHTLNTGNIGVLAGIPQRLPDGPLQAEATVTGTAANRYRVDDFHVTWRKHTVRGSMELDLTPPHPVLDMQLDAALDPWGPLSLSTRLSGSGDRIGIERLDLQMGTSKLARVFVSGGVGNVYPPDDIRLKFHILGEDLTHIQNILQRPVLVRGPFAMSGQLLMDDQRIIRIPELTAVLGRSSVRGTLQMNVKDRPSVIKGNLTAHRLNLERLLSQEILPPDVGKSLLAVGPSRLTFEVSAPLAQPSLRHVALQAQITDLASVAIAGTVGDLSNMRQADLHVAITGPELSRVGKAVGHHLPLDGPFAVSGSVYDHDGGSYRMDDLEVSAFWNTLRGSAAVGFAGPHTALSLDLATDSLTTRALPAGRSPLLDRLRARSDLGPLAVKADLDFSGGVYALRQLHLTAGKDDFMNIAVKGSVGDLAGLRKIDLLFNAAGRDLAGLETVTGRQIPMRGRFDVSGRLSAPAPHKLLLGGLNLSLGPNRFTGRVAIDRTAGPPDIESKLTAGHFTLAPLAIDKLEPLRHIPDLGPLEVAAKLSFADGSPSVNYLDFSMGDSDTIRVILQGTVGSLEPLGAMTFDFDVASRDLGVLDGAYGTGLIDQTPVHVSGRLEDSRPDRLNVTALNIQYGDSDLSGSGVLDLSDKRPALQGRFSSGKMNLRPFQKKMKRATTATAPSAAPPESEGRVFSSKPFDLAFLHRMDAEVAYEGRELLFSNFVFNNLNLDLKLENGALAVDPLNFDAGGGNAIAAVFLQADQRPPGIDIHLTVSGFDAGPMLRQLGRESTLEGKLDARLHLNGSGDSPAALMGGLNGDVRLTIHDGRIQNKYLALLERYLGSNVLDLINPFQRQPDYDKINCLISTNVITDGHADCKLVLDTEQTALAAAGTIDLKNEALNIGIKPSPKKGFGEEHLGHISFSLRELSRPFGLGGTLARPQLILDPSRTIVTAGKFAGAVFLGPVGLALFFSDISLGEKNICEEASGAPEAE